MNLYIAEIVVSAGGPVVGKLMHNVWAVDEMEARHIADCFARAMDSVSARYCFDVKKVIDEKDVSV